MITVAVIPARNEAATIAAVVRETMRHVDRLVLVDDGSDDDTFGCVHGMNLHALRRPTAGGKAAALADGFDAALALGAGRIVTLDGDGQHDPAEIPRLLAAAAAHPESQVLAARIRNRHRQPRIRRFANRFADFWISWASGQRIPDSQTGFRVYPRALITSIHPSTRLRHGFVFETAMLIDGARAGFSIVSVPVDSIYAANRRASHFRPVRDVWEIFCFVSRRIVLRGFYPTGLWRMLTRSTRVHCESPPAPSTRP